MTMSPPRVLPARAEPVAPLGVAVPQPWRPTRALQRVLAIGIGAAGLSLALGRADLAAIAAPLVFLAAMGLSVPGLSRTAAPGSRARLLGAPIGGQPASVAVHLTGTEAAQLVTIAVPHPHGPGKAWNAVVSGRVTRTVRETVLPEWGPIVLARPDLELVGPDGLLRLSPGSASELVVTVPPPVSDLKPLALAPISAGWAGDHASRRPGQGGELIDLRAYAPGDRLRSIHWRAFARHGALYVRRTQSDADADFAICLDTRVQVRPIPAPPRTNWQWTTSRWTKRGRAFLELLVGMVRCPRADPAALPPRFRSSLDLTVEAAGAIAAAQGRIGDRVGLLDLGADRRGIRLGAGTRHLNRLRHQLAATDLAPWRPLITAHSWGLPSTAVVVLLSPLTDDAIISAAVEVQGRGHQLLVVDTLPIAELRACAGDRQEEVDELELLLAERNLRLDRLRQHAVPTVIWEQGTDGVAVALAQLRRVARNRR